MKPSPLFLGIDIGTSGCRAIVIDQQGDIHAQHGAALPDPLRADNRVTQDPQLWWEAVQEVIREISHKVPPRAIAAVAVDATSSTILLADIHGQPLMPALMYNDASAIAEAQKIKAVVPRESAAHGPSSGLAKLLALQESSLAGEARYVLHQADWIAGRLSGRFGISDANNCLKLGYDPVAQFWPGWLKRLGVKASLLPWVLQPGTPIGQITPMAASSLGLAETAWIIAGTTDSTAGVLATGASEVGDAVTSLGSTLVCKVVAAQPISAPEYGIYSQPFQGRWLVGGGSNAGGTTLRQLFTATQIERMTPLLKPNLPTGLDYYPLPAPGERFPIADPHLPPRLTPRPTDDVEFFQGILEGLAHIELTGYRLLQSLGAPYPTLIRSIGGGAKNSAWADIRHRSLQIPIVQASQQEAAYGSALLAQRGYLNLQGRTS